MPASVEILTQQATNELLTLPPLPQLPSDGRRCNARIRNRRGYCTQKAMPNGRCKWHGGHSLRGLAAAMAHKKSNFLPPVLLGRYEQLNGDALDNLAESIQIQQAMETRFLEQLATGESGEAWAQLNELIGVYEASPEEFKPQVWTKMKSILHGGMSSYSVRKEIQGIHESQRKLTETLVKARKEVQETFSMEQWQQLIYTLLDLLKREVDTDVLRRVALAIQEKSRETPQLTAMIVDAEVIEEEAQTTGETLCTTTKKQ